MKPKITPEGQAAANRIKEARQNVNNGATPAEARATVRQLDRGPVTGTVSADDLVNPPAPVNPPVPNVNTNDGSRTNNLIGNVATNNDTYITAKSAEAAKAKEISTLLGSQTFDGAGERSKMGNEFGLPDNLARLGDIQTQLAQRNTESKVTQSRIEGGAGQTLGQAQREVTQEQREASIRDAGLAAEASVLQGNIETASTLINQAMSDYYQDRQLTNQNMIQQLDYFSGIADEQTKQLLQKEQRAYEKDQKAVERVIETVDAAMTSGAATPEDMRILTNPKSTDEERLAVAQGVVSRGAEQMRTLEIQKRQSELYTNSLQQRKYLAEMDSVGELPTSIIEQDGRKMLINSQTGDVIKDFGTTDVSTQEIVNAKKINSINIIDNLLTDPGKDRAVGAYTLSRWTPIKVDKEAYSNFIATVDQLTKDLTLEKLSNAKAEGVTFGALAGPELSLVADAATKINSWRKSDETGKTLFYETGEESFNKELDTINNYKKLDAVLKGTAPESIGVQIMDDGTYWTTNSDGSFVKIR